MCRCTPRRSGPRDHTQVAVAAAAVVVVVVVVVVVAAAAAAAAAAALVVFEVGDVKCDPVNS